MTGFEVAYVAPDGSELRHPLADAWAVRASRYQLLGAEGMHDRSSVRTHHPFSSTPLVVTRWRVEDLLPARLGRADQEGIAMLDSEVEFYTQPNYAGTAHTYPQGTDENLSPDALTDRFASVRIGKRAKVFFWNYEGVSGERSELTADSPDITDIGRPTRFLVADSATVGISIRFVDSTGAAAGRHSLKADSFLVGSITIPSGSASGGFIGKMDPSGQPVTTALFVRDESSGAYVAVGSVHFVWNNNRIEVSDSNLPENLECRRMAENVTNVFIFTLTSTE
ncbi:beta/gamma crystallin domain-containing protein [Streptomyces sp. NPDC054933]